MKLPIFGILLFALGLFFSTSDAIAQSEKEFCNRGVAKQNKGDFEGALADYNRAIALDPYDPTPYNNRGLIETAKGNLDAAITDFNHAVQIDAKNAETFDNRGIAIQKTGDLDAALE